MQTGAILFDMDGTVLDTLDDLTAAVNAALQRFGRAGLSREQVRAYVGNGSRVLIERAFPDADAACVREILAWYKPYYNAHCCERTQPYPGILPLLTALRGAGLRLAVVSNKPDRTVRELSRRFFGGLIDLALGENEEGGVRRKPWPDMLVHAAARLDVGLADCLYVGDSEVDLATAAAAGVPCLSVTWGFRSREQLLAARAERLFDSPEELAAYLLK